MSHVRLRSPSRGLRGHRSRKNSSGVGRRRALGEGRQRGEGLGRCGEGRAFDCYLNDSDNIKKTFKGIVERGRGYALLEVLGVVLLVELDGRAVVAQQALAEAAVVAPDTQTTTREDASETRPERLIHLDGGRGKQGKWIQIRGSIAFCK